MFRQVAHQRPADECGRHEAPPAFGLGDVSAPRPRMTGPSSSSGCWTASRPAGRRTRFPQGPRTGSSTVQQRAAWVQALRPDAPPAGGCKPLGRLRTPQTLTRTRDAHSLPLRDPRGPPGARSAWRTRLDGRSSEGRSALCKGSSRSPRLRKRNLGFLCSCGAFDHVVLRLGRAENRLQLSSTC
jgi:hypothetical protein